MASNQTFTLNIKALFDASDVRAKVGEIQNAFKSLKLPDNLKNSLFSSFSNVEKALNDFESRTAKGVKTKADATGLTRSMDKVISEFTKLSGVVDKVKAEIGNTSDLSKIIQIDDATIQKIGNLKKEISDLQEQISEINASKITDLENILNKISGKKAGEYGKQALNFFKQGDIEGAIKLLDEVIERYKKLQGGDKEDGRFSGIITGFEQLREGMERAKTNVAPLMDEINQKSQQIGSQMSGAFAKTIKAVNDGATALNNYGSQASSARDKVDGFGKAQAQLNTELEQVKSRIVYFLGLTNAVNLFKRSIRSAFNTVKELDAAMTETAVVTDKTISDMWKQLPEYTARANSLGVTTLDAYKAATLYYQQGLNDQQAAELSVETLRMARIAGLEAADATDRMTNALRGFNMELNAMNAQHIDDVYSQLAAMSASNVDEISTAMTKVASLAHNANMDFETTAAFLAQIIETTRESAETAGTALKTVVARFSEVKKLVSEDQLKGQDEEGQAIDVNKVSQALRTAGIDLNKYFIGEVGLDDIFMELASKWDSLTSIQQRYIATQAAGSRQQSRFIAMMQDYARTQELVSAAYNSNGASARQFEKTQDSLQSKLARLKNAWDAFLMGVTNNGVIKVAVSALTLLLNVLNKIADAFGPAASGAIKFGMALGSLAALRKIFVTGGGLTKLLGGLGNTKVGTWLGFGGNKMGDSAAQAGVGFKAQVASAGQMWQAAVARSAGVQTTTNITNPNQATNTLSLWGRIQQFKANSLDPRQKDMWKLDPAYLQARQAYRMSPTQGNLRNLGQARLNAVNANNRIATPKTLFGALGNKFAGTKIGGGIAKGIGAGLGKIGIGTGAAVSGAAALATTLGVAAAVAGLAYIGIKKLYDASPKGQLKIAEKYAKAIGKVAENSQKAAQEMREVQQKTQDYEQQLEQVTNNADRRKIIQEQNEYLVSLMGQDSKYAQYITTSYTVEGQLHLTLDQEAFDKAVEEANKGAIQASAVSNLALANVEDKKIPILQQNLYEGLDLKNKTATTWQDYDIWDEAGLGIIGHFSGNVTRKLTDEEYAKQAAIQAQLDAAKTASSSYRNTAVSSLVGLYGDNVNQEILGLVTEAISKGFDWSTLADRADEIKKDLNLSDTERQTEYLSLYGHKLDEDYDKDEIDEIDKAIAYGRAVQEKINNQIPELIDIAQDTNGQTILGIIAKTYEGDADEAQEAIQQILENDKYKTALSKFLGVNEEDLEKRLIKEYTQLMNQYQQLRKTLSSKLLKVGLGTYAEITATIQKLNIKQVKQLSKYVDKFTTNYGKQFSRAILSDIARAMSSGDWEGSYLEQLVNKISDNPILALQELQNWVEKGNRQMQDLASAYLKAAEADATFSKENLTKWFFMSDEYDNLTEQIDKFIEENGQINSHNIEELAKESATLQAILDMGILSANGLANAVNALSKGNIAVSDLTDDVIRLYEAFDTTANAVQRAGYYIKNFNPGEDYGDAIDFINSGIEQLQEFLDKGEIGNPQFQNYMGAFFDELPDQDDIAGWQERIDLLKKVVTGEGAGFWTDILGFNREGNFIDMNVEDFAKSGYNSYIDYIKSLVPEGYNFSDEFYDMMLRNAQNHDAGAFKEIAQVELNKLLDAYKTTTPTKADIQVIADAYGIDPEELYQAWYEKHKEEPGFNAPEFYEQLEDKKSRSRKTYMEYMLPQEYNEEYDVYTATENPMQAFMQKYGIDETGHFSIDHLYANIGEIVPEVKEGSISPQEWLQEQIDKYGGEDGKVTIPVTAKVTSWNEDEQTFEYKDVSFNITGASSEELEASYYATLEKVSQEEMASALTNTVSSALADQTETGVLKGFENALAKLIIPPITVPLEFDETSATLNIGGGSWQLTVTPAVAKGGIVKSAARGTVEPGLALTGEEAPEIVWNKEKGYAYLAGKNGPEINNLQPGDQIFNGEQTRQILKRSGISSFAKGTIPSYSQKKNERLDSFTYWTDGSDKSGSSGGSSKSSKEWKNELDWLYDLMEDIAEEEHKQTLIQSEYELAEKDLSKTGRDLFNLTKSELETLQAQLSAQQFAFEKRLQQMNELQQKVNAEGFQDYLQWNPEDNTLEIDWDKINEITDKDTYDKLSDLVSDMEKVQDQMDEAQEATLDIKKQIQELQTRYLQAYLDFQNRVMEAVVAQYQQNIDSLSELNDTINEANESILDSIQKEIDLQRQIRDNTDTEKEIADIEARLAMLQRDTTGANQQEILELQKQLDEARENYSDTLVDQAIDRLSQNNDDAQEQREKQIELLEAQLEYWQETGALWEEVANLIAEGFTSQGSIIEDSTLWEFLKDKDSWKGLSQAQKDNWANELILESAQVGAYLIQLNDGTEVSTDRIIDSIIGEHGLAGEITAETRIVRAQLNELIAKLGGTPIDSIPGDSGYASGGLATKTGYAMLHGTANEPEYVLNARQTDAFLRLADVLPSIFGGNGSGTNNFGGNVYVELNMSVGEIGSDYDVDRLVARVKDDIYDASSYRNVNAVSFLR